MTDLQDLGREIGRLRAEVDRRISAVEENARDGAQLMQDQGTIMQRIDFELKAVGKGYDFLNEVTHKHVIDPSSKGEGLVMRMRHLEAHAGPDGVMDRALADNTVLLRDVARTVGKLDERVHDVEEARKAEAEARKDRRRFGVREVLVPLLLGLVGGVMLLAAAKLLRLA